MSSRKGIILRVPNSSIPRVLVRPPTLADLLDEATRLCPPPAGSRAVAKTDLYSTMDVLVTSDAYENLDALSDDVRVFTVVHLEEQDHASLHPSEGDAAPPVADFAQLYIHTDNTFRDEPREFGAGCLLSQTVLDLKKRLAWDRGIPAGVQELYIARPGSSSCQDQLVLEDHRTLQSYGLSSDITFHANFTRLAVPAPLPTQQVSIKTLTGKTVIVAVDPLMQVIELKQRYQDKEGVPPDQQRIIFAGEELRNFHSLAQYDIQHNSTVHMVLRLRGGKPIIYVWPARGTEIDQVEVAVELVPSWEFSGLYPLAPVTASKEGGSRVKWSVSAKADGTLVDLATGTLVSSLFWEAETTGIALRPPTPPLQPTGTLPVELFDPSRPRIDATNAVLLDFADLVPYLVATLENLTLPVAARTEFMTYWIDSFLRLKTRGKMIAIRFLPQAAFEPAARLAITPKPDVVTRVFMLFSGVREEDLVGWDTAAKPESVDWREVVGVSELASDADCYRVLEWGGMEVR